MKLNRTAKTMILLLVLLLVIVCYAIIGLVNSKEESQAKDRIFDVGNAEVVALTWDKSGIDFSITRENGSWKWTGDEKFPVNQEESEKMAAAVSNASRLQVFDRKIEQEYGFEDNGKVINAEFADGSKHSIKLGNEVELVGGSYAMVDDNEATVYIVDGTLSELFVKSIDDLLQTEIIDNIENPKSFIIELGDGGIRLNKQDGKWISGEIEADEEKVSELMSTFLNIKWEECYSYNADNEKKSECGFDTPQATVSIQNDFDEVKLLFGKDNGDEIFVKLDGSNMIYLVKSDIKESLNVKIEALLSDG